MEHREDWREVEWKENQLYNPYMLSPTLCSTASPATSTVSNLPQSLHFHAIWMFRSYSDCSIVLFWSHRPEEPPGRVRASRVARLCPKAKILLCCNYLRKLVAFFWMWDGIQVDWRICARLRSRRHPAQLDLTWTPCTALSLLLCMLQPPVLSSHSVSSYALGNKPAVLSISLPTCWGSVSHWLPEEERHCFGNLPLATVRWVRNRINSRNTDRIFTSFRQWGLTGYSCTITPTGCGPFSTVG